MNTTKEDARSRSFKAFNKNPHWNCLNCGTKNQEFREICLGCNRDKTLCLNC